MEPSGDLQPDDEGLGHGEATVALQRPPQAPALEDFGDDER